MHPPHFRHDDFQFGLEIALGACQRGAADAGEVLVTAARIKDGDADAWVREWTATADAVETAGRAAAAAGRRVSALAYLRRAATYLASALDQIDASHENQGKLATLAAPARVLGADRRPVGRRAGRDPLRRRDDARLLLPRAGRGSGRAAAARGAQQRQRRRDLADVGAGRRGGERARLPLDDVRRPRAAGAAVRAGHAVPARLGGRAHAGARRDAGARGRRRRTGSRVIGVSQAGFWVPRALAFEHRFAAAVADPGVVDVSTSWLEPLPKSLRQDLEAGKQEQFDQRDAASASGSPARPARCSRSAASPTACDDDSRFELYEAVTGYRLGDEVGADRHAAADHRARRTSSSGPASRSSCSTG